MSYLRKVSTGRLLAGLTGILIAILAGTAIAIAAVGSGPVPPPKPLATAVHDALSARSVPGISARVTFTNHLIDSTAIQGADPLLSGGSGRLWLSPDRGLRLELQSDNGDAQLVVNRGSFWAYDPASNTVYEGSLPGGLFGAGADSHTGAEHGLPTVAQIQTAITRLATDVAVSSASPGDVAGRPTYTVRISPKSGGGLLGGVSLAWDAVRGVPLRFAVYARGESAPVLELKATDISYGAVSSSVFSISPPSGAHVVRIDLPAGLPSASHGAAKQGARSHHAAITGARAVASHVTFTLDAPSRLAGLGRSAVRLLGQGSQAGALVAYGQGLGGIYVIERPASAAKTTAPAAANPDGRGLHLPGLTIHGAQAQELPTALGTVLQFTRGGVSYTVLGSVPRATAEQAARGL